MEKTQSNASALQQRIVQNALPTNPQSSSQKQQSGNAATIKFVFKKLDMGPGASGTSTKLSGGQSTQGSNLTQQYASQRGKGNGGILISRTVPATQQHSYQISKVPSGNNLSVQAQPQQPHFQTAGNTRSNSKKSGRSSKKAGQSSGVSAQANATNAAGQQRSQKAQNQGNQIIQLQASNLNQPQKPQNTQLIESKHQSKGSQPRSTDSSAMTMTQGNPIMSGSLNHQHTNSNKVSQNNATQMKTNEIISLIMGSKNNGPPTNPSGNQESLVQKTNRKKGSSKIGSNPSSNAVLSASSSVVHPNNTTQNATGTNRQNLPREKKTRVFSANCSKNNATTQQPQLKDPNFQVQTQQQVLVNKKLKLKESSTFDNQITNQQQQQYYVVPHSKPEVQKIGSNHNITGEGVIQQNNNLNNGNNFGSVQRNQEVKTIKNLQANIATKGQSSNGVINQQPSNVSINNATPNQMQFYKENKRRQTNQPSESTANGGFSGIISNQSQRTSTAGLCLSQGVSPRSILEESKQNTGSFNQTQSNPQNKVSVGIKPHKKSNSLVPSLQTSIIKSKIQIQKTQNQQNQKLQTNQQQNFPKQNQPPLPQDKAKDLLMALMKSQSSKAPQSQHQLASQTSRQQPKIDAVKQAWQPPLQPQSKSVHHTKKHSLADAAAAMSPGSQQNMPLSNNNIGQGGVAGSEKPQSSYFQQQQPQETSSAKVQALLQIFYDKINQKSAHKSRDPQQQHGGSAYGQIMPGNTLENQTTVKLCDIELDQKKEKGNQENFKQNEGLVINHGSQRSFEQKNTTVQQAKQREFIIPRQKTVEAQPQIKDQMFSNIINPVNLTQIEFVQNEQQNGKNNATPNVLPTEEQEFDKFENDDCQVIDFDAQSNLVLRQGQQTLGVPAPTCDEYYSESDSDSDLFHEHQKTDPLLPDKQQIVTQIYNTFINHNKAIPTQVDFYRTGRIIGRGASAKVVLAQHKLTTQFVAIKCLKKAALKQDTQHGARLTERLTAEMCILQKLTPQHDNIVQLYDSFQTENHLCFVFDLCGGGDLLSYIRRRKRLSEPLAAYFFKQVCLGVQFCHSKAIVHRDVKAENLLLDEDGLVKLCDFGASKKLQTPDQLLNDYVGTPAFMAPEEHAGDVPYLSQPAEVWSLGCLLYTMVSGQFPFKPKNYENQEEKKNQSKNSNNLINETNQFRRQEMSKIVQKGNFSFPETFKLSQKCKDLISAMLQHDPSKRPSVDKILKMSWVSSAPSAPCSSLNIFTQAEQRALKAMQQVSEHEEEPIRLITECNISQNTQRRGAAHTTNADDDGSTTNYQIDQHPTQKANCSETSQILAPFNTTLQSQQTPSQSIQDLRDLQDFKLHSTTRSLEPKNQNCNRTQVMVNGILTYSAQVRQANRQYEFNHNGEIDNGVLINNSHILINETNQNYKNLGSSSLTDEISPNDQRCQRGLAEEVEGGLIQPHLQFLENEENNDENSQQQEEISIGNVLNLTTGGVAAFSNLQLAGKQQLIQAPMVSQISSLQSIVAEQVIPNKKNCKSKQGKGKPQQQQCQQNNFQQEFQLDLGGQADANVEAEQEEQQKIQFNENLIISKTSKQHASAQSCYKQQNGKSKQSNIEFSFRANNGDASGQQVQQHGTGNNPASILGNEVGSKIAATLIDQNVTAAALQYQQYQLQAKLSKKEIDMLIVCKIENEFGYPEHYILNCLKSNIKNDATTCYWLLRKDDKNEQIELL